MKNDLGPQSASDNPFTKKARRLQSIWRMKNELPMGVGPNKQSKDREGNPTYYGNMIHEGENTGGNFYFKETFEYAKWMANRKLKDETIDVYRLFNNLLSSMPMAFNLFHPLMMLKQENPSTLDHMLKEAFPFIPSIFRILEIGLEFLPTPIEKYTNDKSAMDAFIRFQDKNGLNYLIAIEVKYFATSYWPRNMERCTGTKKSIPLFWRPRAMPAREKRLKHLSHISMQKHKQGYTY